MATTYYCYPREGFTPEVKEHEGKALAHAGDTPFWCAQDGAVFRLDDSDEFVPQKVYTWDTKKYAQLGPSGHPIGHTYPEFTYRGTHYDVHRLMALAWIGPIPEGWEVDHVNGNILDWRLENIHIVTVGENRKRAVILRARRFIAAQDNDPSKDPLNMRSEELLALFNAYNVAGDCYEDQD